MTEDSIASDQSPFSFAAIDDVCWKLVAQFAAPPDSKCLALLNNFTCHVITRSDL
jgi:hypothetical protein